MYQNVPKYTKLYKNIQKYTNITTQVDEPLWSRGADLVVATPAAVRDHGAAVAWGAQGVSLQAGRAGSVCVCVCVCLCLRVFIN